MLYKPVPPKVDRIFALHYGQAKAPLVRVVPDLVYPQMWRMDWPDGRLSDLGNLSRIKDAAAVICERGPPRRDPQRFHWKINRCDSLYGGPRSDQNADPLVHPSFLERRASAAVIPTTTAKEAAAMPGDGLVSFGR